VNIKVLEGLISRAPAKMKIALLKKAVDEIRKMIAAGYMDRTITPPAEFPLLPGEEDLATVLYETDRKNPEASELIAVVCAMDANGNVVRNNIVKYNINRLFDDANADLNNED
jgi:hypothetical protein